MTGEGKQLPKKPLIYSAMAIALDSQPLYTTRPAANTSMLRCGLLDSSRENPPKFAAYVRGGVLKRSTRADCKSAGYAYVGSNPTPSTRICASGSARRLKDPGVVEYAGLGSNLRHE